MFKVLVNSALCIAAMAASAQQVTLASPSLMQFSDPGYGVTFRYPAQWNYGVGSGFYLNTSITSDANPPRGAVFVRSDEGFNPLPDTNFDGAEFVYTNRKAASIAECSASLHGDADRKLSARTIGNLQFVHAHAEDAGMCHQAQEDLYATYRSGTCYLFDLAVHTICPGVKDSSRAMTGSETARIQSTLEKILSSVTISDLKN